jgi:hypothetical protein
MANHCIDVICLGCGANYCLRCYDRYDAVVNGHHVGDKRKAFDKYIADKWRHYEDKDCAFCGKKKLYADPF